MLIIYSQMTSSCLFFYCIRSCLVSRRIIQDYLTNTNFKISSWMVSISSCLHRSSPLKFENRILIRSLQVTNVQLKYTREGKFRHFGFVGFKTDDDAKNAQKYFNGTFIGSSKISVEVCADLGDESKPR